MTGVYYWDGWWSMEGNDLRPKPGEKMSRLLDEFPNREPVWGWVASGVENMEQQIKTASEAKLDFFAFDWYYPEINEKYSPMNDCVDYFIQAKNNDKMRFCLLVANHQGFLLFRKDWETVVKLWIPYLKNERAVKIGNRPLIIFFADLKETLGSSKIVRECTDYLRKKVKEAGLDDVFIALCMYPDPDPINAKIKYELAQAEGFDGLTGYNYIQGYHYKGNEPYIHSYEELVNYHISGWDIISNTSPLKYMPVITCGWDARPRESPGSNEGRSWYYPDRTPKQVYEFTAAARTWVENNPSKTVDEKIILIYAWNEYGEGGFLAPTLGDQGAYLDAVKRAIK